ncbi:hypothetical protein LTR97_006408 [Elasticomyces elasticus]|uniref:DUF8212 domain-containing protein n=1 Tax=Elasticomyces elasticus TaxID=574655 RepID=A0AAN7W4P6_9PEZI|nr:hypothetical protein LTR97_006408 [Elasticomyces elasticus]
MLCREVDGQPSEWLSRGWTLQELLAPRRVRFWTKDFQYIATLHKGGSAQRAIPLMKALTRYTGIPGYNLTVKDSYLGASVAQKMSWAASRTTTRVEDIAYCLLGLFSVDMPPLYGEGHRAFLRLQMAIIEQSEDESIFAWRNTTRHDCGRGVHYSCHRDGFLARSPSDFRDCGQIEADPYNQRLPYRITNKGLEIVARAVKIDEDAWKRSLYDMNPEMEHPIFHMELSCYELRNGEMQRCIIALRGLGGEHGRIGWTGGDGGDSVGHTRGPLLLGRDYSCDTNREFANDCAALYRFFIMLAGPRLIESDEIPLPEEDFHRDTDETYWYRRTTSYA